ncbi:MAG: RDD family protein [Paucibacter sp.]|nr:RDD family protein [Roseateles sp.]
MDELRYVGFWARVVAALVDTVVVLVPLVPLLYLVYGSTYFTTAAAQLRDALQGIIPAADAPSPGQNDWLVSLAVLAAICIPFWLRKQATPGKMLIGARVVDARTGGPISARQAVIRVLGYFVSTIPLGLGLLWVGIDKRKQGWHDKLAGTLVVRRR